VDAPRRELHDVLRGRRGAFDTTVGHLQQLIARRHELDLKIRMNFTVMRSNLDSLVDMARLAQRLRVKLYLNLATDTTFLFRDQAVTEETHVESAALDRVLGELEKLIRADPAYLPRFSELRYMRGHFSERLQRDLPCAESQLKLMIHSRGEIGGCWGHDPTMTVREKTVAEIIDSAAYRDEHARLFRKDCVGCGSNYSLNLRWRPGTYVRDAAFRAGAGSLSS
jgi:MoaA/NifB/PqqE/SkfB family radical SAM enzyme